MSSSRTLITVLDAELRRAGPTCADVACELGLAELAHEMAAASPPRRELRLQQERAVIADPRQLLVAICTLSRWTLEPITDTCALGKPQAVACLLAQDFAQQRLAGHKRPAADRQACTLLIGMRSWLFAPFRALQRPPA